MSTIQWNNFDTLESYKALASAAPVDLATVMSGENEMKLIALVNDPENRKYTYQWQVSEDGGKTYTDIENETEDVLRVELDETNINDFWRVRVKAK